MPDPIALRADGDVVLLQIPSDFPGPYSALVRSLHQQLSAVWIDWVAVREAYVYGRGRLFPVGRRQGDASADERAKVRASPDGLTAYLILHPPKPQGRRMTEQELMRVIQAYGIPADLRDSQAIRMAFLRRTYLEPEPFATGRAPLDGAPAWIEWYRGLPSDPEGFLAGLRAHDASYPDEILGCVEGGDLVGSYHAQEAGVPGFSVFGEPIPARPGLDPTILGPGVAMDADGKTIRASRAGHLRLKGIGGIRVSVVPLLRVREPQDLEPWRDRVFPGSVLAEGDLEVRFPVRILGDMEVRGGLVRSSIEVMGSLFVRDGIIHYGRGPVRVGGVLSAAFLDRAWVVGGTVHIRRYSLQSRILAAASVIATDRLAAIQGGQLTSRLHVEVGELGSPGAMVTDVAVGSPSFTATFQDLYYSWASAIRAQCAAEGNPAQELVDAAGSWERTAQDLTLPEVGAGKVVARKVHAGVTVRIGAALRLVGNTTGPVTFSYERIGDRDRVAMTRGS